MARMDTALLSSSPSIRGALVGRIYFLPMTARSIGRLAVAVSLCGALWMAQVHGQQAARLNLVKVKDALYVIHNDYVPGNSTALITGDGVVLVDDKFEIDHDNIIT